MTTPTKEQEQCVQALESGVDMLQVRAVAGSGKEQPLDTIVQTPAGPRQFGSLRVGDYVIGGNGRPTAVLAIYPQGVKPAYRVTFRDGTSTRCGLEHLWSVKNYKKYETRSLKDILRMGFKKSCGQLKFQIPLTDPVEYFENPPLEIPAYTLGILIGDGYLAASTPCVSVAGRDADIVENIQNENTGGRVRGKRTGQNCVQYSLSDGGQMGVAKSNRLRQRLDNLALCVKSSEKRIPKTYLLGSVEDRWALLQGLMDAGGSTSRGRTSFSSTSRGLVKDVCSLVHSLGGTAIVGAGGARPNEFHVNIKVFENPFRTAFKRGRWAPYKKNPPSRYIANIEYVGDVEQMCISVAAPDGLYLTDDFIVTHNTSTLVMMANRVIRPSMYLAFNKVTADEGSRKFPGHVRCSTTHSRAYAAFGAAMREKLSRPRGKYVNVAGTGSEIAKFYGVNSFETAEGVVIPDAFIGLLARDTVARFEQSAEETITRHMVPTYELKTKLNDNASHISYVVDEVLKVARLLWRDRIDLSSKVLATHDTYLKRFQLSKPIFGGIEVLYVDEFQDTTPCVLDIVLNQRGRMQIVMVGDARQAIYGWRGAVNAMEMVKCTTRMLTKSFRYGQAVADVATAVLERDIVITGNEALTTVAGVGGVVDTEKPHTRLFRTNSALLTAAIDDIVAGKKVSVEIDVKDFVKLLESAIALFDGDSKKIKHEKVIPFTRFDELVVESKTDAELGRVAKVVKEGIAQRWISVLQSHTNAADPQVVFTTAHKSKGREWQQVIVENDFKSCYDDEGDWIGLSVEEQNLLYVAVTRAQCALQYNMTAWELIQAGVEFKSAIQSRISKLERDVRSTIVD